MHLWRWNCTRCVCNELVRACRVGGRKEHKEHSGWHNSVKASFFSAFHPSKLHRNFQTFFFMWENSTGSFPCDLGAGVCNCKTPGAVMPGDVHSYVLHKVQWFPKFFQNCNRLGCLSLNNPLTASWKKSSACPPFFLFAFPPSLKLFFTETLYFRRLRVGRRSPQTYHFITNLCFDQYNIHQHLSSLGISKILSFSKHVPKCGCETSSY